VLPSTVQSSIAFTSMAGGNVPAAICAASASNIFGMFLTPLLVGLLFSVGGHGGFSWDALLQILLQLLLPFILGQILQPWIGNWIRAKKKLLMPVDRGSILMVVYLAFSEAVVEGLWHTFSISRYRRRHRRRHGAARHRAGAPPCSAAACSVFNEADEITITFCGSKKSLASGVPMANVIFAGQAIGAIVLPLMLFHQIQLMACAVIAQKYAAAAGSRHKVTGSLDIVGRIGLALVGLAQAVEHGEQAVETDRGAVKRGKVYVTHDVLLRKRLIAIRYP
jgi:sodium/bile acid cotransporter 7